MSLATSFGLSALLLNHKDAAVFFIFMLVPY
jgi:hypothetical protein